VKLSIRLSRCSNKNFACTPFAKTLVFSVSNNSPRHDSTMWIEVKMPVDCNKSAYVHIHKQGVRNSQNIISEYMC